MGERISYKLKRLLADRKILRIKPDKALVLKEVEGAESDLATAKESLEDCNFKWATVQGYYSIFHAARALLFSEGFREKSHSALLIAVQELFNQKLEESLIQGFRDAMNLRQTADYGLTFSAVASVTVIETAEKFLFRTKELLNAGK